MPLQYQEAANEIEAVLKKHDLAGIVVIGGLTHTEYKMFTNTSWSCARVVEAPGSFGVRVRAKRADYPSKEEHARVLTATVGMILGFMDVVKVVLEAVQKLGQIVAVETGASHVSRRDPEGDRP